MFFSKSFNPVIMLVMLTAMLSACGGGGGGGDDGLVYSGKTSKAKIRSGNAPELTGNVVDVYGTVGSFDRSFRADRAAPRPGYVRAAMQRIADIRNNQIIDAIGSSVSARLGYRDVDVDEETACVQGRIRVRGVVDDVDGTGVLTFDFQGCRLGGARIDGEVVARIDAVDFTPPFDLLFTRLKLTFNELRIRDAGVDVSIAGSAKYTLDVVAGEENETIVDLVIADNIEDRMLRIVDLVSVYRFNDLRNPTQLTIEIVSGRVYDSKHGYVNVRSRIVVSFSSIAQEFPDAGEIVLSADGSILAQVLSSTMVRIQVDTDGDTSVYEFDQTLNWTEL